MNLEIEEVIYFLILTVISGSLQDYLEAQSNTHSVAKFIYRALTAQRRNRLAGLTAESHHDGIINNPVAARQFFPQGEFRLVGCVCFDVTQPVGNSVHMCINANGVFAVGERDYKIGGFAADAFDSQQVVNIVRHFGGETRD